MLVVGDAMLDRYWYGAVDRISPEAPVPVVRVTREEERIGGAANVAYNIVTLGAQASLLSVVGDDEASHQLEALVAETGITPYFGRDAELKTTVKLRVIGRQQQLLRLDFENTPKTRCWRRSPPPSTSCCPQHDAVLFSDYGKGGLAHIALMIDAGPRRRQAGAGRSQGRRLLTLQKRHRHHAQPRRAGAGGWHLARRGRPAHQGAQPARGPASCRPCC